MNKEYQRCTRCVMDTTDPDISFDESGICNHCRDYAEVVKKYPLDDEKGRHILNSIVSRIKEEGKSKKYDCIIGVSGGVDSTYVAYKVKQLGLRPLAVHLDNGWNSELAVSNIEKVLNSLGIDLYTYVLDWEEFKNLQLSFLKASVPDVEIPTDHAIKAVLYKIAAKEGVRYIISGSNKSTESCGPSAWANGHSDWRYINSVNKKFGKLTLKSFPHYSIMSLGYYRFIKRIKYISILDYMTYNKAEVMRALENELNWNYYGGKHYESIFTRFLQGYILPQKFNIDKRKSHLSSLICSGQMSRDEALLELEKDVYGGNNVEVDKEFVIKKLGLTREQFDNIMALPPKSYWDYPSYKNHLIFKHIYRLYHKYRKD